jgi:sugar phosphate isomerase/epimerase
MTKFLFNGFNASPYLGGRVSLFEQIDVAAAAGFDLIALDRYSLEAFEAQGGIASQLERRLCEAGIGCGAITAAAMLGAGEDTGAVLRRAGGWAANLGAPFIQINIGVEGSEQAAALEAACEAVDGKARLAIEYLPITPLARVSDTVALARGVGFDRAGVMIDIWHHERGPDAWDDLAKVAPEAVAYVEFDDALAVESDDLGAEMMSRRTFPGSGVFDCARFAQAISAIGAADVVSIEVLNAEWRVRDLGDFARQCLASSRPFWM